MLSKAELVWVHDLIQLEQTDIPKAAVPTPFALFEFVIMLFKIVNEIETYQRFMYWVARNLENMST